MQKNAVSKLEYQGLNQDLLQTVKTEKGYKADEWMTFIQAKQNGRSVRKGEHGVSLVRVVEVQKKKKGKLEKDTYLKHFTVFNIEQTEEVKMCPGCLKTIKGFPALSRFGHGDICSDCGVGEAMAGDFIGKK